MSEWAQTNSYSSAVVRTSKLTIRSISHGWCRRELSWSARTDLPHWAHDAHAPRLKRHDLEQRVPAAVFRVRVLTRARDGGNSSQGRNGKSERKMARGERGRVHVDTWGRLHSNCLNLHGAKDRPKPLLIVFEIGNGRVLTVHHSHQNGIHIST